MQIVSAQPTTKPTGDARIKDILDKLGVKYKVLADGDFKLLVETENKRTQVVFIESKTEKLGNLEIRYIAFLSLLRYKFICVHLRPSSSICG